MLKITSTGIQYDSATHAKGMRDPGKGKHYWVITAAWRVTNPKQFMSEKSPLDMENLLMVSGVMCFKCERPYHPMRANKPCKGSMEPFNE